VDQANHATEEDLMPLYEYECDRCKRRVEELRAMKDRATLYACAACDNAGDCGLLYPLLSVPGFRRDHTTVSQWEE
jgi:putative FmdB family regulatory protein